MAHLLHEFLLEIRYRWETGYDIPDSTFDAASAWVDPTIPFDPTSQVVINTGVVAGLVPPKGLVLPFVSYGASAAMTHTIMVALLLRVGLETHRGGG